MFAIDMNKASVVSDFNDLLISFFDVLTRMYFPLPRNPSIHLSFLLRATTLILALDPAPKY